MTIRNLVGFVATAIIFTVAVLLGRVLWVHYMDEPWTRDGRVRAEIVNVAPDVSGAVVDLPVKDNQLVRKGDLLMQIDPSHYQIAVEQAQAAVAARKAELQMRRDDAKRRADMDSLVVSKENQENATHTASAAEEFASHVAGFGFGKLVGETTTGAAYRNDLYPVAGAYVLSLSIGRPELPKGGNWEGAGVKPAIATAYDRALAAAQADALGALADKAAPADRNELAWLAIAAKARMADPAPQTQLAAYVGSYGERSFTLAGGQLHYARTNGVNSAILPIGPDLFVINADPRTHIRFLRKDGAISGFQFERMDGTTNLITKE